MKTLGSIQCKFLSIKTTEKHPVIVLHVYQSSNEMNQTQSGLTDLGRISHVICLRTKPFSFHNEWDKIAWFNTVAPVTGSESDSWDRSEEAWPSPCEPASEPCGRTTSSFVIDIFGGLCVPGTWLGVQGCTGGSKAVLPFEVRRVPMWEEIKHLLVAKDSHFHSLLQPLLSSCDSSPRRGSASVRHNLTKFVFKRAENLHTKSLDNSCYLRLCLDAYFCMSP